MVTATFGYISASIGLVVGTIALALSKKRNQKIPFGSEGKVKRIRKRAVVGIVMGIVGIAAGIRLMLAFL